MKAIEFRLLLCVAFLVFFTKKGRLWIKPWCATIHIKAIEQFFHVVQFIMLSVQGGSNF